MMMKGKEVRGMISPRLPFYYSPHHQSAAVGSRLSVVPFDDPPSVEKVPKIKIMGQIKPLEQYSTTRRQTLSSFTLPLRALARQEQSSRICRRAASSSVFFPLPVSLLKKSENIFAN